MSRRCAGFDASQELADREAIRDLARRYAHYVWQKEDRPRRWTSSARTARWIPAKPPPLRGRAALLEAYQRMLGDAAPSSPSSHNHVDRPWPGTKPAGSATSTSARSTEGRSMIGSGYYEDRYRRVDGEWKFQSRRLHMSWLVPLDQGWADRES